MTSFSRCSDCPLARSVLDSKQLAELLGLSPNSIASIRSRYPTKLPPPFLTRPLRWRLETVQRWIDQHEQAELKQAHDFERRIQNQSATDRREGASGLNTPLRSQTASGVEHVRRIVVRIGGELWNSILEFSRFLSPDSATILRRIRRVNVALFDGELDGRLVHGAMS